MKEKNIQELAKRMGLVTVEDMCQYTIAQLVVKIANKVNELVNEVWRFETDVQEILKTHNENIQYLLGEGLHLEVENIFDGWIQDGTFDTLLNQSALKKVNDRIDETNAQLSQKANTNEVVKKGYGTLNDFDEETRRVIQGIDIAQINAVLGANNVTFSNLNADTQYKLGEFVNFTDFKKLNGYVDGRNGNFSENSGYYTVKVKCTAGQIFKINTKIDTSLLAVAVFYDINDNFLSSFKLGEVGEHFDLEVIVPNGASYVSFTYRLGFSFSIKLLSLKNLSKLITDNENKIEIVNNVFSEFNKVEFNQVNGYYEYRHLTKTFVANDGYISCDVSCESGEEFICTTNVTTPTLAIVIFYDNNNNKISSLGDGQQGNYTDYSFKVPEGATSFTLTATKGFNLSVSKKEINYNVLDDLKKDVNVLKSKTESGSIVLFKNGEIFEVGFKYKNQDMRIEFKKHNANNLMQIANFYLVDNDNRYINSDFGASKTVFNPVVTDWIGPYFLRALKNADGNGQSYQFTGGCHGFNGNQTGSATARLVEYSVCVDGFEVIDNGVYFGNSIRITTKNRVQAYNTKKEDGTGREVIEEFITYTITDNDVHIENEITSLEDVRIEKYYGIQTFNRAYTGGTVTYVDGVAFSPKELNLSSNCGTKSNGICNKMIIESELHKMIAYVDDIGLGRRMYIGNDQTTAHTYGEKCYFDLILDTTPVTLSKGDKLYVSGGYQFFAK